ncbi:ferric reductase like transmembrane component-domain-containing protein [Microdochium trichocladiopsis]|uniref:Ferric reductase like transmembrane component-domain-containing protein n=1 Tax=Microdochium trichocladiopsis TaxID=1682393 RepID=A0A9P8Y8H7_9PEZI|nr:ferric reductase like transmembrane component-domain-containing protein [Microdochium trichocladiopsis]KAH7032735.1 ferric reductase like transmembrane component-domain-containing protein [Microdochium trichocladiopsis]
MAAPAMDHTNALVGRHIQNMSEGTLQPHWGYADRVIPCTNDPGSCTYLDAVYDAHDVGMYYTGIIWATGGAVLLLWALSRRVWRPTRADEVIRTPTDVEKSPSAASSVASTGQRLRAAVSAGLRRHLLPDSVRAIFGRTTRLQVLILAILTGYITIFSFIGIVYGLWITPVKNMPGVYNTRSSLGPWSDRIGVLAYALTPLSIMLSSRESILSLITGIPYQSFNFLHRWLGYIIVVQGVLHTIGWTIIEVKLYQPQPKVAIEWITQLYMIWGIVALILLLLIFALSTPWGIRLTGYEFFRKAHYVLAMVYIGACWAHWVQLRCFMLPGLLIWFVDRAIRIIRTALVHYQHLPDSTMGFRAAQANISNFPDADHGDVVRLDFKFPTDWKIGQHFYLCFPQGSIWQSHPFTPLSLPNVLNGKATHSYIFRAKKGETKKLAELAVKKLAESKTEAVTPVILQGPYGESIADNLTPDVNILCVAGGTGITYVLPTLLSLIEQAPVADRKIELVWAVRKRNDVRWVQQEINVLHAAARTHGIRMHIFVTREQSSRPGSQASRTDLSEGEKGDSKAVRIKEASATSSSSGSVHSETLDIEKIGGEGHDVHPDLIALTKEFVAGTAKGRTAVIASGPGGMISDLRSVVAQCNNGGKVWNGAEQFDVSLTCDDRLEW